MPSPTTALQIIEDALGLTNAVGSDQTLTNDEVSDCLRVFNDVMEEGSIYGFFPYAQANQTFSTVAAQAVYTVGTGGNWNTTRPEIVYEPAYATISGVSFPYAAITQAEYNLIGYKAQPGGGTDVPQYYLFLQAFPMATITLWPVPDAVLSVTFSFGRVLAQVTNAATAISFPQGYAKAFKYKLGVELPSVFGKSIDKYPHVIQTQRETWGAIKRVNMVPQVLQYDSAISNMPSTGNGWTY